MERVSNRKAQVEWLTEEQGTSEQEVYGIEHAIDTCYAKGYAITYDNLYQLTCEIDMSHIQSYMHSVYGWEV